jgi:ribosomal protein S18 acetylase RimI-like enzyme
MQHMSQAPEGQTSSAVEYRTGNELELQTVIELYRASTLGLRRPVDEPARMQQMLDAANLVITAWDGAKLVGIARSLSDFTFCTYMSDLAVHLDYQRSGIGKELIRRTHQAGGLATLYLFAAPAAVNYYPHIGMEAGSGWLLKHGQTLP